jgi:hypothetical protein
MKHPLADVPAPDWVADVVVPQLIAVPPNV